MLTVPGPCVWQRQPTAWDNKQIYRTYIMHLKVHGATFVAKKVEGQGWDVRL